MRYLFNNRYLLLITGIVLIVLALLSESIFAPALNKLYVKEKIHSAQEHLREKEAIAAEMLERAKNKNPYKDQEWYLEKAKKEGVYFYIYSANNLRLSLWTTNSIKPKVAPFQDTTILESLDNGYYVQQDIHSNDLIFITLIPVEYKYSIQNNYLKNSFALLNNGEENFHLLTKKSKEGTSFFSKSGLYLFDVEPVSKQNDYNWIGWLFLIGLICYCMFLNGVIVQLLSSKRIWEGILLYAVTIILPLVIWHNNHYPQSLFEWQLFRPGLYASSALLSSLGYLLILSTVCCWTFRLFSHIRLASIPKFIRKSFIFIQAIGTFLIAHVINAVLRSLIYDSKISFDLGNISEISIYTVLAFAAITGLVLAFFIVLASTINNAYRVFHEKKRVFYLIGAAAVLLEIFSLLVYHISVSAFIFSLVALVLYTLLYKRNSTVRLISYAVILCTSFITLILSLNNDVKDNETRKVLASHLLSEHDAVAEYMFGDVYDNIKNDNFLPSYFSNPFLSHGLLRTRITQLYLSDYFGKYDVEVFSYNEKGQPYKGNFDNALTDYTSLVTSNKAVPARDDSTLYFLNSYNGLPAYLSFVPVEKDGEFVGNLVLLFTQKAFYEESAYPELILSENLQSLKRLQEYSYAIYINNYLITQKGDYSYNEGLKGNFLTKNTYSSINANGYTHFIYKISPEQTIIVSDKREGILYYSATFSFILFFFIFVILSVFILRFIFLGIFSKDSKGVGDLFRRVLTGWKNLSFRSKVLLSITSSMTIALLLIGFTTIKYISYHYNEEELQKLTNKTRAIKERLETQLKNDAQLTPISGDPLTSIIKSLSKLYQTDINVYDIEGKLLGNSQPIIYDKKLLQTRIDPVAYYNFTSQESSSLICDEKIGNLNYIASFMPLRNYQDKTAGFINLPFFAKERELDDAISSFLVALVNLYLLLFLGLLLIGVVISNALTAPLNIIRKHLRLTSFTAKNEPIKWENNDEIGKLVREYNSMVLELSESASRLAQSEREGAWREMAKQVAHEIKNPLTPMKLNIQQLQRAWKEDPKRLQEMFDKVTTLLITQIERLSQIATEFSTFAQMPNEQPVKLDVNDALREAVDLFHTTNEVSISLHPANEPLYIWIDAGHFARVLNNLIKNAIQAMPDNKLGIIALSCKRDEDRILVEIRDNGSGIEESLQDKIFTPNFSTKSSGMGLGLAIVRNIVERAGGNIWFDTKIGEGTSFFISLGEYKS